MTQLWKKVHTELVNAIITINKHRKQQQYCDQEVAGIEKFYVSKQELVKNEISIDAHLNAVEISPLLFDYVVHCVFSSELIYYIQFE